jgi:hypothetical protein
VQPVRGEKIQSCISPLTSAKPIGGTLGYRGGGPAGPPRAGAETVTVPGVEALPGRVRIIGRVGPTGAVEY